MTDVLVLCYHAVSPDWDAALSVTPEDLEAQVSWLLASGYVPATFTQAVEAPPAPRTLAITFDDGFQSVRSLAFPVLERLGAVATLFVPSALLGDEPRPLTWDGIDHWLATRHAHELTGMTWDSVRELQDAGWEIGSHTCSHPHLTTLGDDELEQEIVASRAEVERQMGRTCTSIAYPYGDVDDRVAAVTGRAGYRTGATLPNRFPGHPVPLLWPRVGVYVGTSDAAFRRRVSPATRRLMASPAWSLVTLVLPQVRRLQSRARGVMGEAPVPATPALRFLTAGGRVVHRRPAILAAGMAARAGALEAYTLWPSASHPVFIIGSSHSEAARWMSRTLERDARRRARVSPGTWNAVRARALVMSTGPGLAVEAAERGLGRPLDRPRVAAYSPSGTPLTKTTCFVFEGSSPEPTVVVKGMGDATQVPRLRAEVEVVEQLRARLSGAREVVDALPLAPIHAGVHGGEYMVVQALDPMAKSTGRGERAAAMGWLRRFHELTTDAIEPVDSRDVDRALLSIEQSWGFARPHTHDAVAERVRARLAELGAQAVPRCFAHGDFWRGNMAVDGGRLRVYDWEWTAPSRLPAFDVWTYELADLRDLAQAEAPDEALEAALAAGLGRVEREFEARGMDPRLALATIAPSFGELSFRFRVATGTPAGNEAGALRIMGILEPLIGLD